MRKQPLDEKRLRWARRGVVVFSPLAIALVVTAWSYEKYNNFEARLKEMEEFYQSHKDEDINSISFVYNTVQGQSL